VKICHFYYPEKLQSKASKHKVGCKIINAFRNQDYQESSSFFKSQITEATFLTHGVAYITVQHVDKLKGSMKEPNISIYFFFLPITQWWSISNVLFTGGREVSDFSVLKYY